jgi:hypothetical protein
MAQLSPVTFLVGAGLCIDAGLDGSVSLALKLALYLQELAAEPGNDEAKTLLNLLYFILGGIRFQWGRQGIYPDQPINIEQIATAALRLRFRHDDPLAPYVSAWSDRIMDLEKQQSGALEHFSDIIFARLKEWLATPHPAKIEYLNRISDIHGGEAHISIFSLNYDMLIENALVNAQRPFINGFREGRWNPELFNDDQKIRIYKLHGSLDWVEDEMYGVCSLSFDRHPKAEDFEVNKSPLLIFGTNSKITSRDPFLSLVHAFAQHLRSAQVLVVIGYSFSDKYINDIIEQRMRDNLPLRLILAAPDAEKLQRSQTFLENSPRVTSINCSALEGLNTGLVRNEVLRLLRETKQEAPF